MADQVSSTAGVIAQVIAEATAALQAGSPAKVFREIEQAIPEGGV